MRHCTASTQGDCTSPLRERSGAEVSGECLFGPANDCRIDCKTAPHGDGTCGTGVAPTVDWPVNARAAVRSRCTSAALAARANIRRFDNLLQVLGAALIH